MTNTADRKVVLVINARADLRPWLDTMTGCLRNGRPLPEELADIFTMTIVVNTPEEIRGVVDFA